MEAIYDSSNGSCGSGVGVLCRSSALESELPLRELKGRAPAAGLASLSTMPCTFRFCNTQDQDVNLVSKVCRNGKTLGQKRIASRQKNLHVS